MICKGSFSVRIMRTVRRNFRASNRLLQCAKAGSGSSIALSELFKLVVITQQLSKNSGSLPFAVPAKIYHEGLSRRVSETSRGSDMIFSPSPWKITSAPLSSFSITPGMYSATEMP